ncbi:hypothetical protein [Hymenobacter negativus]|uniref:Glycosyltransferase RgtA/B/C/D-like domain-containing protein n=1 Tax=Hymenobacter negativus TaxID=2795026 RepID=A0ABS3QDI8_9BACT|nr:hypothetical protein [Hymenobacter negativus]MBO2009302.1 hypothetical protein [Hymenobacter negativus]
MKIFVAVLVNLGLLAVLVPWLRRQWQWAGPGWWRIAFVLGLALRLAVATVRNWLLLHDAEYMHRMGKYITSLLWTDRSAFWHTFTDSVVVFQFSTYQAMYQSTSNTWFLIKILALLNLGSLSSGLVNSLYLSLFTFIGCWQLVRALAVCLPRTPAGAGIMAFLLWPTVWFWDTGLSKEAVLLGSGAWLVARVLHALYGMRESAGGRQWVGWWMGTIALAVLHFYVRYFFAMPLLGVLLGIGLAHGLQHIGLGRRYWVQALALAAVLGAGLWLAPQLSVAFRINKFTHQVVRVYADEIEHTDGRPHITYPDLRPTVESMVAHAPRAALNTFTRPWLGEARQPMYIAASLENLIMIGLSAVALLALARGKGGHCPFIWGLGIGIFCLILAMLVGLTTPNFGLLSRYRSEIIPFFVLLLLQNDYAAARLRWLAHSKAAD